MLGKSRYVEVDAPFELKDEIHRYFSKDFTELSKFEMIAIRKS